MDASCMSVLWYRRSKPLGKVRRRVQDLRIPSSYYNDFTAVRPKLDLSHNESARLAVDCLLSQGLEGYHKVLNTEGEVDFLSELEKNYILENGKDGNTADSGASDDDYKELKSLSSGSQSATQCPVVSTDSDPTVAGLDQSLSLKDVKWTDAVLSEPSVEVYFQSDSRAAGMKDLVREFMRKAQLALAIVMDSFSDTELLCDLLVASRKRNVSVHLLLDHLNLNLFVTMWQDLKLDSRNFPKLSVRSVDGQTYCAKTGRKLTGQIAESFIFTDWTEVLTGSYSFSWLSWQVHRSLAVRVKGSAIAPFHQEFHRLYSSSEPVPGFVTFMAAPPNSPLYVTSHAAQNENTGISKSKSSKTKKACHWDLTDDAQKTQAKANMPVLTNPRHPDFDCNKGDNQPLHREGRDTQMHTHSKPPLLYPKPLAQPGTLQRTCVEKPKHTLIGASTQHDAKTQVEPHISHSKTLGQTHISYNQSQPAVLTAATTAEKNAKVQESNPHHTVKATQGQQRTVCYQSASKKESHLEYDNVGTEGLLFQQRSRNRLTSTGLNTQRGQWKYSLNFKQKVELQSNNPKLLSPSGLQFPLTHSRGHQSGLQVPPIETRRQDQPKRHHQPPHQSYPTTTPEAAAMGAQLKPQVQRDPEFFFIGPRTKLHVQPQTCQQVKPVPRLNWMLQSHSARPRLVARTNSFDTTYEMRQKACGSPDWRPARGNMNAPLGQSKSFTDRHTGS